MRHVHRMGASFARLALAVTALTLLLGVNAGAPGKSANAGAPQSPQTFSLGVENSWIRVQNVGANAATVTVSYFNASGAQIAQDTCPSPSCPPLGPGGGWTFFQAQQP